MKLSKSEAGRLGSEKSTEISRRKMADRIMLYNINPKTCEHCHKVLDYNSRHKKFCNSSCSASHNNKNRVTTLWKCDNCGKVGAFDFMGDYLCPKCANKVIDKEPCNRCGHSPCICGE